MEFGRNLVSTPGLGTKYIPLITLEQVYREGLKMIGVVKQLVQGSFQSLGYRLSRMGPSNRFQAMEETLSMMRRSGYEPTVIIDGGANVGNWTRVARSIYPDATVHLIEPQPGCAAILRQLVENIPRAAVYHVAITEPGVETVRMVGGGEESNSTGSFVAGDTTASTADEIVCPATTLDELLADKVSWEDRALLKLDLENHEITALRGAARLLNVVEVVLTEFPFYNVNKAGGPVFADYVLYMRNNDFELYDFASLSHRPRDMRLRQGDAVFVRRDSNLLADHSFS